jgi:hypothetical protein
MGLQRSVQASAIPQGWARPVRQEQAQGILVAALGMLERVAEAGRDLPTGLLMFCSSITRRCGCTFMPLGTRGPPFDL